VKISLKTEDYWRPYKVGKKTLGAGGVEKKAKIRWELIEKWPLKWGSNKGVSIPRWYIATKERKNTRQRS